MRFSLPPNSHSNTNFRLGRVAVMALLFSIGVWAASPGSSAIASPGSAVDQYVEQIPEAEGNERPPKEGSGDPSKHLGDATHRRFREIGPDGTAAAELAAAAMSTDPAAEILSRQGTEQNGTLPPERRGHGDSARSISTSDLGLGGVFEAATGTSDGKSVPILPIVALIVVLAMAATVIRRRTRSDQSGSAGPGK